MLKCIRFFDFPFPFSGVPGIGVREVFSDKSGLLLFSYFSVPLLNNRMGLG